MAGSSNKRMLLTRLLEPLKRRVQLILGKALLKAVNDAQGIQLVKMSLLNGEVRDNIEHLFDYGYSSHAPNNSEAVCGFINGNRSHGIALKIDNRTFRFKNLKKGEVALYTDEGDYIHFQRENKMLINCNNELTANVTNKAIVNTKTVEINATTKVDINTPTTNISGNVNIGGNVVTDGDETVKGNITSQKTVTGTTNVKTLATGGTGTTIKDFVDTYNTHTHPENGDGGGTTSAPNQTI